MVLQSQKMSRMSLFAGAAGAGGGGGGAVGGSAVKELLEDGVSALAGGAVSDAPSALSSSLLSWLSSFSRLRFLSLDALPDALMLLAAAAAAALLPPLPDADAEPIDALRSLIDPERWSFEPLEDTGVPAADPAALLLPALARPDALADADVPESPAALVLSFRRLELPHKHQSVATQRDRHRHDPRRTHSTHVRLLHGSRVDEVQCGLTRERRVEAAARE